ncbi:MAG: cytochrome c3 family protein [Planctomycetes bacterium]|nr:cytochrome c3 family protein [Planctomycetota bacterium]
MNALLTSLALAACTFSGLAASPPTPTAQAGRILGPDVVILDQVVGCYGSVRFDHRLHTQMSTIQGECKNCHHELQAGSQQTSEPVIRPCRTCHEPMSTVVTSEKPGLRGAYHRQCLSCHKDWSHENACGYCHTSSAMVRGSAVGTKMPHAANPPRSFAQVVYTYQTGHAPVPVVTFHHADHAEKFGLQCVDCHGGSSCGQCHGSKIERPVVNREESCFKCHTQSRCVTCHDRQERPAFDHSVHTRWWLRAGHAALACSACHVAGEMPRRPTSDSCKQCHAQRWGDTEFDHARTGVALRGDHEYFDCLECHRGGDQAMLASCSSCHTERYVAGERRVGRVLGELPTGFPQPPAGVLHAPD